MWICNCDNLKLTRHMKGTFAGNLEQENKCMKINTWKYVDKTTFFLLHHLMNVNHSYNRQ